MDAELLGLAHLSLIGRSDDPELHKIEHAIAHPLVIDGRADLEATLCALLSRAHSGAPKTLDLIGHSTAGASLLALGTWVIDASSPIVTAFFRELADQNVLPRLGVTAVRLLGCSTAETAHGKWTMCALAEILGIEVYGTTGMLLSSYYDERGFSDERRYLLTSASQLRQQGAVSRPVRGEPSGYVLDIDALPPLSLEHRRTWPVHVVGAEQAREILSFIRRREGATMPGLTATPSCEIALPSSSPGAYHRVEVLCDGELVRVHPQGVTHGIVYPVNDPETFRQLVGLAR